MYNSVLVLLNITDTSLLL